MYRLIWVLSLTTGAFCITGLYRGFDGIMILSMGLILGIALLGELLTFKLERQENGRRR